jgi:hypothetical protein
LVQFREGLIVEAELHLLVVVALVRAEDRHLRIVGYIHCRPEKWKARGER